MKCTLVIPSNELTIRDYTIIEDEGIGAVLASYPEIKRAYKNDEEFVGNKMMVITSLDLQPILKFLSRTELPVRIIR